MSVIPADQAQVLPRDEVRELDRLAVASLGIPSIVLMENAGRNGADVILDLLRVGPRKLSPGEGRVAIFCGGGNNGGDGYVIARHLHNAGVHVRIFAAKDPGELDGDARVNADICRKMDLEIYPAREPAAIGQKPELAAWLAEADVIVDALLGTGFQGEVREPLASLIELINAQEVPQTVAADVPSGLDCQTGEPANATVRAAVTVTFAANKEGFLSDSARPWLGELLVADIGTPPELIDRVRRQG
ncbi:MAG: NAD(P)H-hydrate epimerase [Phycisphaeraceae bacterium]